MPAFEYAESTLDPFNSDTPHPVQYATAALGGTDPQLVCPAVPNYPDGTRSADAATRYFMKFPGLINVDALGGARPIILKDGAQVLTPVGGVPDVNEYRVANDTSEHRTVFEMHSGQAGNAIDYDLWIDSGALRAADFNNIAIIGDLLVDGGNIGITGSVDLLTLASNAMTLKANISSNIDNADRQFIIGYKESPPNGIPDCPSEIYSSETLYGSAGETLFLCSIDNDTASNAYPLILHHHTSQAAAANTFSVGIKFRVSDSGIAPNDFDYGEIFFYRDGGDATARLVFRTNNGGADVDLQLLPEGGVIFPGVVGNSAPPTDAELDADFGTPAAIGTNFVSFSDNYIVYSDGTNWRWLLGTIAV